MFSNCHSLISLKIDNFNVSLIKTNYEGMFLNCYSLISLNLTNFYPLINSSNDMFSAINPDLIYCIDDKKDYIFLSELQNNTKNCSAICIDYNSQKYKIEGNSCIDSCSIEKLYEYNNICYKECPNNTILVKNSYSCIINSNQDEQYNTRDITTIIEETKHNYTNDINYINNTDYQYYSSDNIEDTNSTEDKQNKTKKPKYYLIFIIVGVIVFIAIIIVIICCCCKRNKNNVTIIFNKCQELYEMHSKPDQKISDLLNKYCKKNNIKKISCNSFLCNGLNLALEENKVKKINDFLHKEFNPGKMTVLVYDNSDMLSAFSSSTTNIKHLEDNK